VDASSLERTGNFRKGNIILMCRLRINYNDKLLYNHRHWRPANEELGRYNMNSLVEYEYIVYAPGSKILKIIIFIVLQIH
jgi:hypothetical protein